MRTKTLLLTAALCAAGVASSMAQVYSVNVVGYSTTVSANTFALLANPLDKFGNNSLTNVLNPNPAGGSGIQFWNGVGFTAYNFQAGHWRFQTTNIEDNVAIPPGTGFFLKPSANYTNIFTGQVAVNPGNSGTNVVPATLYILGSLIPYADAVTNTATVNMHAIGGWQIQKWNQAGQTFQSFNFQAGQWKTGSPASNSVPSIGIGEGFFIKAGTGANNTGTNWVESL